MISLPLQGFLIGALVASSLPLFTAMRAPSLLRYYSLMSLLIAMWVLTMAYREGSSKLYTFALIIILVKVFFLPSLLTRSTRRSGAPLRLQSYLRPASSSFLAFALLLVTFFTLRALPSNVTFLITPIFTIATYILLLGLTMMVVRRDTLSLIVAFLLMENGISLLSMATVTDIPLFVEICIFFVVAIGTSLFSHLFSHAYAIHGTTDSAALRELTD